MDRSLPLFLIGLVFGAAIGFVAAAANGVTLDGHDHGEASAHGGHGGGAGPELGALVETAAGGGAPTLSLAVAPDPASGWNLRMTTENFRFAPENASLPHVPGEGHAHVYVNGVKLGRFYGPWVHLADLPAGEVTVEVTLNANDHRTLAVAGSPVAKTITIRN